MISDCINIGVRLVCRLLLRVFWLLPIKQNRYLFQSYYGKSYSCNPKYLCQHIEESAPSHFELIWVFQEPIHHQLPEYIIPVKKHSLQFLVYRFTAKVIVTNMTDEVYLPKRRSQIVVNTWHAGGAYKKIGDSYKKTDSRAKRWQDDKVRKETSLYLSSSELFTKYNIHEAYGYKGDIVDSGLPRNDLFFDADKITQVSRTVRSHYGIGDAIIVLYAPTFRGDFADSKFVDIELPFSKLISCLKQKYNRDVFVLTRLHYSYRGNKKLSSCIVDVSDYPDMQELLIASDYLITDYSSSIWDYSLLERPCFLYVPDLEDYDTDRGFYTPIETWPGILCKTDKELLQAINNYDGQTISEKARQHHQMFKSFERGRASQLVFSKINELCD